MDGTAVVRFPESKIKEAILNENADIRSRTVRYFADSYSPDPDVMPLVIQAVERFGRRGAEGVMRGGTRLVQSPESIEWILGELNDEGNRKLVDYRYQLWSVLENADPALLAEYESAILNARHLPPRRGEVISQRLQMSTWDQATCWRKMEEFCEREKCKDALNEVDMPYAYRIVEALARGTGDDEERVLALLREKVDDFTDHPMKWMELLIIRLAGAMRLESAIPLLVDKLLQGEDDWRNPECCDALTRIGTPEVIEAAAEAYPTAPREIRFYLIDPLERIHSDLAVEKCRLLLSGEEKLEFRQLLAQAMLLQFAYAGIEEARPLVVGQDLGFIGGDLKFFLLQTCQIMGERFPEYDELVSAKDGIFEEFRRMWAADWEEEEELPESADSLEESAEYAGVSYEQPQLQSRKSAGRNDPCPCGSGKKYKKCCGKSG